MYLKQSYLMALLTTICFKTVLSAYPQYMTIRVPVTDLRASTQANPCDLQLPCSDLDNPLQITQLLLGEHVLAHHEHTDSKGMKWLKVNALQQERFFDPVSWHGYPGWILADHAIATPTFTPYNIVINQQSSPLLNDQLQPIATLSLGTRLTAIYENNYYQVTLPDNTIGYVAPEHAYAIAPQVTESVEQLRKSIVQTAQTFIGTWYSWGGRSSQCNERNICSVDCSALTNLSFMAHGLQIPRMSHEQYLRSEKIKYAKDLQPGDLIFFASVTKSYSRMNHVMMYVGDDMILEATYADTHKARVISFQDRMKQSRQTMQTGDTLDDEDDQYVVFFGTFLHNPEHVQELRNACLTQTYNDQLFQNSILSWHNRLTIHDLCLWK